MHMILRDAVERRSTLHILVYELSTASSCIIATISQDFTGPKAQVDSIIYPQSTHYL